MTLEGRAVVVVKLDVDANQEFAAKYGVRNIPTVLVFKNGEVVARQVGAAPKDSICRSMLTLPYCRTIKKIIFLIKGVGERQPLFYVRTCAMTLH